MDALARADGYVGKYYTKDWVMKEILDMSEEEIKNAPEEEIIPDEDKDNA
jgi:hypothetical protein